MQRGCVFITFFKTIMSCFFCLLKISFQQSVFGVSTGIKMCSLSWKLFFVVLQDLKKKQFCQIYKFGSDWYTDNAAD